LLRRTSLLAVGLALALPSVAAAGTVQLSPPASCLRPGLEYQLSGSGFTPDKSISFSGEGIGFSIETDGTGAWAPSTSNDFRVPEYDSLTPKTVTLSVTDPGDPALNTTFSYATVAFGSNLPVKGKPNQFVTWQFAGFINAPIYGHYLYNRKEKRTVAFGAGEGPCGTLSKRAMRFPIKKPKNFGTWEIRIDSNPKWVSSAESMAETSFNVAKPRKKKKKN
jgi:hypothetical protein